MPIGLLLKLTRLYEDSIVKNIIVLEDYTNETLFPIDLGGIILLKISLNKKL